MEMVVKFLQKFKGVWKLACDVELNGYLTTLGQAAANILDTLQCTFKRGGFCHHALLTIDQLVSK